MDNRRIREIVKEEILSEDQSKTMIAVLKHTAYDIDELVQKYRGNVKGIGNETKYGLDVSFIDDLESALSKLSDYTGYKRNIVFK